jgi:hypothetical protein
MTDPTGFICSNRRYRYKGWYFEIPACCGPWPLKKDGQPFERAGRVFWELCEEFEALTEEEHEACRVGGGCERF